MTKNHEEYDDNCPVCQAQKNADRERRNITMSELTEAFKKSKEQGAIVGGSLFDEESN